MHFRTTSIKRLSTDSSDDADTDEEGARARRSKAAKQPRRATLNEKGRREALERDKWTSKVKAHRVRCAGCHKWLALSTTRKYEMKNWNSHRDVCSQITGVTTRHVRLVKTPWNGQTVSGSLSMIWH